MRKTEKNQKYLTLTEMKFTDRVEAIGGNGTLRTEVKKSFTRAIAQVKNNPRAEEWLEKNKDLW